MWDTLFFWLHIALIWTAFGDSAREYSHNVKHIAVPVRHGCLIWSAFVSNSAI